MGREVRLLKEPLVAWGKALRSARLRDDLTQANLARKAGLSRQKIIEVEQGKPGVAAVTYEAVAQALGLTFAVVPATVKIPDFPQLKLIAWNRKDDVIEEKDAFALYERNWTYIRPGDLDVRERALLDRLVKVYGNGVLHV